MATINLTISSNKTNYLIGEEFENLLNQFVLEYIETKEDISLKNSLLGDEEFINLNRKIEKKLGAINS